MVERKVSFFKVVFFVVFLNVDFFLMAFINY